MSRKYDLYVECLNLDCKVRNEICKVFACSFALYMKQDQSVQKSKVNCVLLTDKGT